MKDFSCEDREFLLAANRIVALKECDAELTETEQSLSENLARVSSAEDGAIIERTMQRLLLAGALRAEIARLLADSEAILNQGDGEGSKVPRELPPGSTQI